MADERVTERTDGVTTERVTETSTPHTTVVDRRGGGGSLVLGIILVGLLAVIAWFLFLRNDQEAAESSAIEGAATEVGETADQIGDAVDGEKK